MHSHAVKQRLQEIVARHQVYWEVWPEWAILRNHRREQIGFRLEFYARHLSNSTPTPGCEHCRNLYARLREIANWIMPKEERDSAYEVLSFDAALHYGSSGNATGEVMLAILIVHRSGFERPVDACEVRCLREMEQQLRELGATNGRPYGRATNSESAARAAGMSV
ncbi:MAG TPA: hypothetical protein VI699_03655 [Candidatus Acidoferrales bacterium]|nr:hypothetical protein [Candidatus Acidoferrales bacterium]